MQYAVLEINGKQVMVTPGQAFDVDLLSSEKNIEAKVLMSVDDGKLTIGKPYLKDQVKLDILDIVQTKKIRVAKFHAKANYRKVTGSRKRMTRVILPVKTASKI